MTKRTGRSDGGAQGNDLVVERLRQHLEFLGLNHTLAGLEEILAWATRERPGTTELLEHVLGGEAAHKLERRIDRRIDTSGLHERKTLEAFDWAFQAGLDKSSSWSSPASTSSAAARTW